MPIEPLYFVGMASGPLSKGPKTLPVSVKQAPTKMSSRSGEQNCRRPSASPDCAGEAQSCLTCSLHTTFIHLLFLGALACVLRPSALSRTGRRALVGEAHVSPSGFSTRRRKFSRLPLLSRLGRDGAVPGPRESSPAANTTQPRLSSPYVWWR